MVELIQTCAYCLHESFQIERCQTARCDSLTQILLSHQLKRFTFINVDTVCSVAKGEIAVPAEVPALVAT